MNIKYIVHCIISCQLYSWKILLLGLPDLYWEDVAGNFAADFRFSSSKCPAHVQCQQPSPVKAIKYFSSLPFFEVKPQRDLRGFGLFWRAKLSLKAVLPKKLKETAANDTADGSNDTVDHPDTMGRQLLLWWFIWTSKRVLSRLSCILKRVQIA